MRMFLFLFVPLFMVINQSKVLASDPRNHNIGQVHNTSNSHLINSLVSVVDLFANNELIIS